MHLKNRDILLAFGVVVLNVVWMLLPYHIWEVGTLLALPLVFFVPGYMLIEILAHKRGLNTSYRITLSLGLSLALDILCGFLLNVLPIGLRSQSWVILLSCLMLVFALAVLYLRRYDIPISEDRNNAAHGQQQGERRVPSYRSPSPVFRVSIRGGVVFGLAAVLVVFSLLYAAHGVAEQPRPGFTQLWMLPPTQTKQHCIVHVGIQSFENASVSYHAQMTVNNTQTTSWSALVLAPSQIWEKSVALSSPPAKSVLVEVRLYRDDKPATVYRKVHVMLTSVGKNTAVECGDTHK